MHLAALDQQLQRISWPDHGSISGIGRVTAPLKMPGTAVPTRLSLIDAAYHPYPAEKYPGYLTYLPLKSGRSDIPRFCRALRRQSVKRTR